MLGACTLHGGGALTPRASGYAPPSFLGDRCSTRCCQQQRQRALPITSATEGQTTVNGKTQGGSKTQEDSLSFAEWTQEAGNAGLDGLISTCNLSSCQVASTLDWQWHKIDDTNMAQERLSMLLARVPRQRHQSRHRQGMKRLPAPLHQLAWHRQALQLPLLRAMARRALHHCRAHLHRALCLKSGSLRTLGTLVSRGDGPFALANMPAVSVSSIDTVHSCLQPRQQAQPDPPPPAPKAQKVMDIIFVSAEAAPWSKTGGLGDVVGSLPIALAQRGHRVMVVTPR